MLTLRRSADRGREDHGWLHTQHTFSFAEYYDPRHMGFGALRVINEDKVAPGKGFPTHGHKDMEILSYVLSGALEHKDSLGNGGAIVPGEVQRMSAGRGVRHSEYNPSADAPVHFLQIWIVPSEPGLDPGYEQRAFGDERRGRLLLVASQHGRDGSLTMNQDASVYAAMLEDGACVAHALARARRGWLHVAEGMCVVNGEELAAGDAVGITNEPEIAVAARGKAHVLLFDLGM
jgi:redox-sensitive bicupin YhaK (pirin superfamily)